MVTIVLVQQQALVGAFRALLAALALLVRHSSFSAFMSFWLAFSFPGALNGTSISTKLVLNVASSTTSATRTSFREKGLKLKHKKLKLY